MVVTLAMPPFTECLTFSMQIAKLFPTRLIMASYQGLDTVSCPCCILENSLHREVE